MARNKKLAKTSKQTLQEFMEKIQNNLLQLKDKLVSCKKCPLYNQPIVPPDIILPANIKAADVAVDDIDIAFVGMNPNTEEVKLGKPFVGKSGKLLRAVIDELRLNNPTFANLKIAIFNASQCYIPNNGNPDTTILNCCSVFRNFFVYKFKPKVIVSLGKIATYAMSRYVQENTKELKISDLLDKYILELLEFKGEIIDYLLVPNYHPSFLVRNSSNKQIYAKFKDRIAEAFKLAADYDNWRSFVETLRNKNIDYWLLQSVELEELQEELNGYITNPQQDKSTITVTDTSSATVAKENSENLLEALKQINKLLELDKPISWSIASTDKLFAKWILQKVKDYKEFAQTILAAHKSNYEQFVQLIEQLVEHRNNPRMSKRLQQKLFKDGLMLRVFNPELTEGIDINQYYIQALESGYIKQVTTYEQLDKYIKAGYKIVDIYDKSYTVERTKRDGTPIRVNETYYQLKLFNPAANKTVYLDLMEFPYTYYRFRIEDAAREWQNAETDEELRELVKKYYYIYADDLDSTELLNYKTLAQYGIPLPPFQRLDLMEVQEVPIRAYRRVLYGVIKAGRPELYYNADLPIPDKLLAEFRLRYGDEAFIKPAEFNIAYFDIEVAHPDYKLKPDIPRAEVNALTIIFSRDKRAYVLYLNNGRDSFSAEELLQKLKESADKGYSNVSEYDIQILQFKDERELILYWLYLLEQYKPDILTAWNISFDIDYLLNRMKYLKLYPLFGNYNGMPIVFSHDKKHYKIFGIHVQDLFPVYSKIRYPGKKVEGGRSLNAALTREKLGVTKVEYEGTLYELWQNDPIHFMFYNAIDVFVLDLLNRKLQLFDIALQICRISNVSFEGYDGSIRQTDGILFYEAMQRGLGVRAKLKQKVEETSFPGGFVRKVQSGLYRTMVVDFDASSMYPSIYVTYNLSPETALLYINGAIFDHSVHADYNAREVATRLYFREFQKLNMQKEVEVTLFPMYVFVDHRQINLPQYGDYAVNESKLQISLGVKLKVAISKLAQLVNNPSVIPTTTGVYTIAHSSWQGVFNSAENKLIILRKKEQKVAADRSLSEAIRKAANSAQKGLKIVANQAYGATGESNYRFFHPALAGTSTGVGRSEIGTVAYNMEQILIQLSQHLT